jgi:hypothetical protein
MVMVRYYSEKMAVDVCCLFENLHGCTQLGGKSLDRYCPDPELVTNDRQLPETPLFLIVEKIYTTCNRQAQVLSKALKYTVQFRFKFDHLEVFKYLLILAMQRF